MKPLHFDPLNIGEDNIAVSFFVEWNALKTELERAGLKPTANDAAPLLGVTRQWLQNRLLKPGNIRRQEPVARDLYALIGLCISLRYQNDFNQIFNPALEKVEGEAGPNP